MYEILTHFVECATILVVALLIYIMVLQQIVKPLKQIQFYKNQGIPCEYVPFTGSSFKDSVNVVQKGDYYYAWLEKARAYNRPKLLCKNVGSVCSLILLNPKLIQQLFMNKDEFIKHQFQNGLIKRLSPNGLVLIQGKLWKKHRKTVSKGFEYQTIDSLLGYIRQISSGLISKIQAQKQYSVPNAFNFFKQCAGNIISLVYFQQDIASLIIEGKSLPIYLSDLIADLANESYSWRYCIFGMKVFNLQIFQTHRNLLGRIKKIREVIRSIVQKHMKIRQNGQQTSFSMWDFFFSKQKQDSIFNQDQIIDQFITFFSDGVYTTGHFMMMLTYHLAKNPQWKDRLTKQFQKNLRHIQNPTQSLINNLPIFNACMKQTLRLVPPVVTGIERIATKDTSFSDGTKVLKGTMLFACHLVNHLNQELHDDPNTFNPERWMNPQSKTMQSVKQFPGSFIPFSIGQRHCPGQKFAISESAIFLSQFLTRLNFNIVNQDNYQLKFTQRFLRQPLYPFSYHILPKQNAE